MLPRIVFFFCVFIISCVGRTPFSGDSEVKIRNLLELAIKNEFESRPEQTFHRVAIREKRALNSQEVQIVYETYFSDLRTKTNVTARSRATLKLDASEWTLVRVQPISQFVEYEKGLEGL